MIWSSICISIVFQAFVSMHVCWISDRLGDGSATITATYNGKSATCSVTVVSSPTLSLGWTSASMEKGSVRTNAAIYNSNNGTASTNVTSSATWITSNAGVATVGGGTIIAQGKGTCTITATYNGVSASCSFRSGSATEQ